MKTSETINELTKALVAFQSGASSVPKNASGYGYKYAPLDEVIDAVRGGLGENGLAFVQMPAMPPVEYYPAVALTTRLIHASGEWMEDTMIIPIPSVGKANDTQNYGAALTYARRYALTSILGIATDDDTDGAPKQSKRQAPPKRQAANDPTVVTSGNGNGRSRQVEPEPEVAQDVMRKPSTDMMKKLHAAGSAFYGDEWDERRAALVEAVTGGRSTSSKHLTFDECQKLIDGIEKKANAV